MLKLIIVDDEYLIRQLIRNGIAWSEQGIEVVGEMESAEEAMNQMAVLQPDIVLTDICMPVTDGLFFAEKLKEEYPSIKIIAITGYDNFEYAKRGIHIGLDGYILKPINMDELVEAVGKLRAKIESERLRDSEIKGLSEFKKDTEEVVREYYLTKLLESDVQEEIVSNQFMEELSPEKSDFIWLGVLEYNVGDKKHGISRNARKQREEWIRDYCVKHMENMVWISDRFDRFVILDPQEKINHQEFLRKLETGWRKVFESPLYYGSDIIRNQEKSIHMAYMNAVTRLNTALINSDNEYENPVFYRKDRKKYAKLLSMKELRRLQYCIESDSSAEMSQIIDEWFGSWSHVTAEDMEFLKMQLLNTFFYVYILSGTQYEDAFPPVYMRLYEKTKEAQNLSELRQGFIEGCDELAAMLQNDAPAADTSKLIYSMKQYIKENLDDPDLSLVTLANTYYLNSSYLSRIFKKEVKSSFIEYLTDRRIAKAKQLLRYSNLKIYEVGERVGIYNANYFGILFKKKVGVTPVEYRKQYSN